MRLDDLPPKLRRAAVAAMARDQLAALTRDPVPRAPAQHVEPARGSVWRCHSCGAHFTAWAAALRHVDDGDCDGAARIEWLLP
jgi:hypothetical protein